MPRSPPGSCSPRLDRFDSGAAPLPADRDLTRSELGYFLYLGKVGSGRSHGQRRQATLGVAEGASFRPPAPPRPRRAVGGSGGRLRSVASSAADFRTRGAADDAPPIVAVLDRRHRRNERLVSGQHERQLRRRALDRERPGLADHSSTGASQPSQIPARTPGAHAARARDEQPEAPPSVDHEASRSTRPRPW